MAGTMHTSMRLFSHSMRFRPEGRNHLAMGSMAILPALSARKPPCFHSPGFSCSISQAAQAKCKHALASRLCCSFSWLTSCQVSECQPISHISFRAFTGIAFALSCGLTALWSAGKDQGKFLRCDSSVQSLQAVTGSTLMLYITKERAGFIDDACELLKSQAVDLKHYNVSVDLGRNTRHVYVVQDMATGGSLSEEKLASVRQVLMTLGDVTFVHSVPGKHVVIATPSGNRLVSISS